VTGQSTASDTPTTVLRGGWIVGHDGAEHRIIEDGVVVFRGDAITHVGTSYDGPSDRAIDATAHLVIPGLINGHVHVGAMAGDRMILDAGRRDFFRSGFLNYQPSRGPGGPSMFPYEDPESVIRYSLATLLRTGTTTIVDMGADFSSDLSLLTDLAGELGARLYTCPGFSSGTHYYDDQGRHGIAWREDEGLPLLERAVEFVERHDGDYGGRIRGILVPFGFYSTTPELLRRTKEAARRLDCGITLHLAETVMEFHETVRKTGRTPVRFLDDMGFLGPEVILGHGIYVSGHSQVAYPHDDDLEALAAAGATVAHSPLVFGRRGVKLESFQRYLDAGVNMSIGTDSYPQDILDELKFVSVIGKVADQAFDVANARDVFNAATLGGARALRRDDLGRLAPGARADIVTVDFRRLRIGPFLDPIKALVHCGNGELVDTVIVAGETLVEGGRLLEWDEAELLAGARKSSDKVWRHFADYHPFDVPRDEAFPPAFKSWNADGCD